MNDALKNSVYKYGRQPLVVERKAGESNYTPMLAVVDRFKGTWNDHVTAAKSAWGLLNERELMRSEGHPENLKWLIQGRYTMSPRDANEQVEKFIQTCGY